MTASGSAWMFVATMSWFAAFTVCPEPAGPTCTIVLPTVAKTGFASSKCAGFPAGDRRIQHAEALVAGFGGEVHGDVGADRGEVDDERPGLGVGEHPVLLVAQDAGDVRGIGDHDRDDVGVGDGVGDAVGGFATRGEEVVIFRTAVAPGDVVSRILQVYRHG